MVFFIIIGSVIGLVFLFHFVTKKYLNPFKLTMIFGKKGCGKTTFLTKTALQHIKRGWLVFSTENIPGTFKIDPSQIGQFMIPPYSVLLVDEVGMVWDNRDFKNFKNSVRDWFKLQRHYKVKVYLFSQTFDIDKKLRDLTDQMYYLENKFRIFSWAKKIDKHCVLTQAESDRPSTIAENLQFEPFLLWPFGSRMLTYIPKYSKYFDSYGVPELPSYPWERWDSKSEDIQKLSFIASNYAESCSIEEDPS